MWFTQCRSPDADVHQRVKDLMILGIGNDLVDIRRIERTLERFGTRFLRRIFTPREHESIERRKDYQAWSGGYAKRFAAKEACVKALGSGFRQGVRWCDIEVVHLLSGQPTITLKNNALKRLHQITPEGMVAWISVSLTHEYPFAQAFIVIDAHFPDRVSPFPAYRHLNNPWL